MNARRATHSSNNAFVNFWLFIVFSGVLPPNVRDQRLAETAFQNRQACSRVRCIALFGAGAAEGETIHLATDEIIPRARARTLARNARESRQRAEETSTARIHPAIRTMNGRFQRPDAASALSAP
jgi:hypothetical protein